MPVFGLERIGPKVQTVTDRLDLAERVRSACLQAALDAYEQAGISGLCGEGRWELAAQAIANLDLARLLEADAETRKNPPSSP